LFRDQHRRILCDATLSQSRCYELQQRLEVSGNIEESIGLMCKPNCAYVKISKSSSKVPNPPRSTIKPSANSAIKALRSWHFNIGVGESD
jgi:hypothetical protein